MRKSSVSKRVLSVIITVAMVLGLVPLSTIAVSAASDELKFGIMSDVHYYPQEYMADTAAFEAFAKGGNKQYINEEGIPDSAFAAFTTSLSSWVGTSPEGLMYSLAASSVFGGYLSKPQPLTAQRPSDNANIINLLCFIVRKHLISKHIPGSAPDQGSGQCHPWKWEQCRGTSW